jgi:hypothetical protein
MKKTMLVLIIGLLIAGVNAYAADGDFIVDGNLGIGTDTPNAKLDVRGDAVFNENGEDYDFRVESQNNDGQFFSDADTGLIGIGTSSPNGANKVTIKSNDVLYDRIWALRVQAGSDSTTGPQWVRAGTFTAVAYADSGSESALGLSMLGVHFGGSDISDIMGSNYEIRLSSGAGSGNRQVTYMVGNKIRFASGWSPTGILKNYDITNAYGYWLKPDQLNRRFYIENYRGLFFENPTADYQGTNSTYAQIWLEQITRGTDNYGIVLEGDGEGADIAFGTAQETKLYGYGGDFIIDTAGNVGIGTASPNYKLQVGEAGDGSEARANAWNTLSDKRLKTNLNKISNAVDKVTRINGYYFNWEHGKDTGRHVGVIAQEVHEVLPEIISEDSKGLKSLDYGKLTPLLIEAIKEQQKIINELKEKVQKLEAKDYMAEVLQ